MKKTLILASLLVFATSTQTFANQPPVQTTAEKPTVEQQAAPQVQPPKAPQCKFDKKAEFEKRLKLTDEQKAKAKALREKGHEEMKPIMDAIRVKREEIKTVRLSRIAVQAQQEKIDKIRGEIRELNKKAHEIRMKNMKEFEAILTKKQLKELNKMKAEGRKKFEKEFKNKHHGEFRPPFPPEFDPDHRHPHHPGPAVPPPPQEK